ncbi:MAG: galactitol-1-phosphate 5-dehydrogenase [Spirochaetes bacterium]|nr:galactitol-1-phosphate 5-dehydrogenase [Spirochaetota bacterium]
MKALVLEKYNTLVYTDVPPPKIKAPDEVLIKVKAVSVCGSDVHGLDGSTGRRIPPIIMGHEGSGVVVDVGKEVRSFKKGDRIVFNSTLFCGKCDFCLHGQINLCDTRKVFGVSCEEYKLDGAFAEYLVVPERILYPIPDTLSHEEAALVEPFSVGFHAVRVAELGISDTVLVIGTGTIGSFIIQSLRLKGAGTIIATDIDADKLQLAQQQGADVTINTKEEDLSTAVKRIAPGGVDIVFDVVGKAQTARAGLQLLKKNGKLVMVGLYDQEISFPIQRITTWQLKVLGTYISSDEYPACIRFLASRRIDVSPFTQHIVPLSQGVEWFKRLRAGERGLYKVIFHPEE